MSAEELIDRLADLQSQGDGNIPNGNFSSTRYHPIFKFSREEDNVYFVSWILQLLKRHLQDIPASARKKVDLIIADGELAINHYRNRYGDKTYNFYRAKAWFPGGNVLGRFVQFQPTDDSDDTSIAMRGKTHTKEYAQEIKKTYIHQSNGLRRRWIKRCPKEYRRLKAYNTWIGSEGLFVDFDFVVMCNILTFNAQYDLGITEQDQESIAFIKLVMTQKDDLNRPWAVSCWYPFQSVMMYSLADVISTGYYSELEGLRDIVSLTCSVSIGIDQGISEVNNSSCDVYTLLDMMSFRKLKGQFPEDTPEINHEELIRDYSDFSFGVIPLTHPFNGQFSQWLGSKSLFRMHYACEAQVVAILLEYQLLRERQC